MRGGSPKEGMRGINTSFPFSGKKVNETHTQKLLRTYGNGGYHQWIVVPSSPVATRVFFPSAPRCLPHVVAAINAMSINSSG